MNNVNKETNFMIDLETLSTNNDAVICSIAIVEFDIKTGKILDSFYEVINIQSCLEKNLSIDGKTIQWWLLQPLEARLEICKEGKSLDIVINKIYEKMNKNTDYNIVWGNGSSFDISILSTAFIKCKTKIPWLYKNIRDLRTIVALNPIIKEKHVFQGDKHNPLHDCNNQIKYLIETLQTIQIITN